MGNLTSARQQRNAPDLQHERVPPAQVRQVPCRAPRRAPRRGARLARLAQHARQAVHLQRDAAQAAARRPQQRAPS